MTEKYLRAKDVAHMLNIGVSSVWRHTKEGNLPKPIKLSTRTTVWNYDEIISMLEQK